MKCTVSKASLQLPALFLSKVFEVVFWEISPGVHLPTNLWSLPAFSLGHKNKKCYSKTDCDGAQVTIQRSKTKGQVAVQGDAAARWSKLCQSGRGRVHVGPSWACRPSRFFWSSFRQSVLRVGLDGWCCFNHRLDNRLRDRLCFGKSRMGLILRHGDTLSLSSRWVH